MKWYPYCSVSFKTKIFTRISPSCQQHSRRLLMAIVSARTSSLFLFFCLCFFLNTISLVSSCSSSFFNMLLWQATSVPINYEFIEMFFLSICTWEYLSFRHHPRLPTVKQSDIFSSIFFSNYFRRRRKKEPYMEEERKERLKLIHFSSNHQMEEEEEERISFLFTRNSIFSVANSFELRRSTILLIPYIIERKDSSKIVEKNC